MLVGLSESYLFAIASSWALLFACLFLFVLLRLWRSPRRGIRGLARVALGLWMLFALVLAAETGFALLYDTTDSFALTKTTSRWYERHVRTNAWECRDDTDYQLSKPTGRRRLIVLGDSFTFGHGVPRIEDRFTDLLEIRLRRETAQDWEIYNLAKPGSGTEAQADSLQQLILRGLEFDACLLVYCLNDAEGLIENNAIIMGTIILDRPTNLLLRESYLANFLYYRIYQFSRPEVRNYFVWLKDAYRGEPLQEQLKQLARIHQSTVAQNARLLVAIFPFLHNLGPDYEFREAHTALGEYLTRQRVPYVDLLSSFETESSDELVVNRFDAHPNERAHAMAAEAIWTNLLKPNLLAPVGKERTK